MPPRPQTLRQPTRKAASLLPPHARFCFLSEASAAAAAFSPDLARHLGAAALSAADNPSASVPRRAALQHCAVCGVHLNPYTVASVELQTLSKRSQKRSSTVLQQQQGAGALNTVSIVRTCKVCHTRNPQAFAQARAAEQMVQREAAELSRMQQTTTMKGSNAATPVSAGDTLIMDKTAAAAGSSPTAVLDSQPGASTPVSPQEVGGGSAPAGAQGAADSSAQAAAARAGARGNGGGGGDACPGPAMQPLATTQLLTQILQEDAGSTQLLNTQHFMEECVEGTQLVYSLPFSGGGSQRLLEATQLLDTHHFSMGIEGLDGGAQGFRGGVGGLSGGSERPSVGTQGASMQGAMPGAGEGQEGQEGQEEEQGDVFGHDQAATLVNTPAAGHVGMGGGVQREGAATGEVAGVGEEGGVQRLEPARAQQQQQQREGQSCAGLLEEEGGVTVVDLVSDDAEVDGGHEQTRQDQQQQQDWAAQGDDVPDPRAPADLLVEAKGEVTEVQADTGDEEQGADKQEGLAVQDQQTSVVDLAAEGVLVLGDNHAAGRQGVGAEARGQEEGDGALGEAAAADTQAEELIQGVAGAAQGEVQGLDTAAGEGLAGAEGEQEVVVVHEGEEEEEEEEQQQQQQGQEGANGQDNGVAVEVASRVESEFGISAGVDRGQPFTERSTGAEDKDRQNENKQLGPQQEQGDEQQEQEDEQQEQEEQEQQEQEEELLGLGDKQQGQEGEEDEGVPVKRRICFESALSPEAAAMASAAAAATARSEEAALVEGKEENEKVDKGIEQESAVSVKEGSEKESEERSEEVGEVRELQSAEVGEESSVGTEQGSRRLKVGDAVATDMNVCAGGRVDEDEEEENSEKGEGEESEEGVVEGRIDGHEEEDMEEVTVEESAEGSAERAAMPAAAAATPATGAAATTATGAAVVAEAGLPPPSASASKKRGRQATEQGLPAPAAAAAPAAAPAPAAEGARAEVEQVTIRASKAARIIAHGARFAPLAPPASPAAAVGATPAQDKAPEPRAHGPAHPSAPTSACAPSSARAPASEPGALSKLRKLRPQAETEPGLEPEAEAEPGLEPAAETEPGLEPEAETETRIVPEAEAEPKLEPEADPELNLDPEAGCDPEMCMAPPASPADSYGPVLSVHSNTDMRLLPPDFYAPSPGREEACSQGAGRSGGRRTKHGTFGNGVGGRLAGVPEVDEEECVVSEEEEEEEGEEEEEEGQEEEDLDYGLLDEGQEAGDDGGDEGQLAGDAGAADEGDDQGEDRDEEESEEEEQDSEEGAGAQRGAGAGGVAQAGQGGQGAVGGQAQARAPTWRRAREEEVAGEEEDEEEEGEEEEEQEGEEEEYAGAWWVDRPGFPVDQLSLTHHPWMLRPLHRHLLLSITAKRRRLR